MRTKTKEISREKAYTVQQHLNELGERLSIRERELERREKANYAREEKERELAAQGTNSIAPRPERPEPREITDHRMKGLNEAITVHAMDWEDDIGACNEYQITAHIPLKPGNMTGEVGKVALIQFQKGSIKEVGLNGFSNGAFLAVVIDRLRGVQSGPFKDRKIDIALTHLEEALMWIQKKQKEEQ